MTKVVRAYSLDISTVEELEEFTRIPGVYKPRNKSKYVNEALQFYMRTNIKEMIEQNRTLKENLTAGLRSKDASIQGLEQQVEDLANEISSAREKLDRFTAGSDCRGLWCRLKKRLQKSQAEQ